MTVDRDAVFPDRVKQEQREIIDLLKHIDRELQNAATQHQGNEPNFVRIEIDRFTPIGLDRHSNYVLGEVLSFYKMRGWAEVQADLVGGNKIIALYFK